MTQTKSGGLGGASADDTSTTVNGLTNGQPYTVVVSACNEVGSFRFRARRTREFRCPPKAPPFPVGATRGDRAIDVTWVADSNGAPILGYGHRSQSNGATTIVTNRPDATSARIEGLVNGCGLATVGVAGTNDVGQGSGGVLVGGHAGGSPGGADRGTTRRRPCRAVVWNLTRTDRPFSSTG